MLGAVFQSRLGNLTYLFQLLASSSKSTPLITAFCVDFTLGEVHPPKLKKTTDTRDFIFLFLAEVIVHKFGIGYSRNSDTKSDDEFTALDALATASAQLDNFSEPLQFSTLSRLRTNNKIIAQLVDKHIKKLIETGMILGNPIVGYRVKHVPTDNFDNSDK